jgi:hypothetical protein
MYDLHRTSMFLTNVKSIDVLFNVVSSLQEASVEFICFVRNSCSLKFDGSTLKSPVTNIGLSVSHGQS